jgi:hypothetical protein
MSEKRIRDYNNNDMGKLMELLGEWRYLLGISSQATERELILLTKFIKDSFQNLTYTDIKTTMMMALQGKLEIAFTPMINFSAKYISDAINEYGYLKSKFINSANELQQKKDLERKSPPKKYTPEERMNIFADIIKISHNMANEKGEVYDFESKIYKWLRDTKQIKMSQEDIDEAIKYGQNKFYNLHGYNYNAKEIDRETKIKKYGRENVVIKYFISTPLTKIFSYLKVDYFK